MYGTINPINFKVIDHMSGHPHSDAVDAYEHIYHYVKQFLFAHCDGQLSFGAGKMVFSGFNARMNID